MCVYDNIVSYYGLLSTGDPTGSAYLTGEALCLPDLHLPVMAYNSDFFFKILVTLNSKLNTYRAQHHSTQQSSHQTPNGSHIQGKQDVVNGLVMSFA